MASALLELNNPPTGENYSSSSSDDSNQSEAPLNADNTANEMLNDPDPATNNNAIPNLHSDNNNASNIDSDNEPLSSVQRRIRDETKENTPLADIQQQLRGKPSTSEDTEKRAEFKSVFHGLKCKYPRDRNFPCTKCDVTCKSQGELNQHFLDTHGSFICSVCNKKCNTISAMWMHKYEHGDRSRFKKCADCDKLFPFESQLKTHREVHLTALEHQCTKCGKWFKSKGEVDKHQAVHSGKT